MWVRRIQRLFRALPTPISGPLIRRHAKIDRHRVDGVTFKVAETRDELEAAYRLAHDVYVQEGYANSHRAGIRVNLRYALPTTATFIAVESGRVVMTVTLVGDSPLGVPMDMIFSRELYRLRYEGRKIAEVTALASDPKFRGRRQMAAMYLNKTMHSYAVRHLDADDLVIAVNPKHEWVYKHLLLFETISSDVKSYGYVNDAPAVAMRLDLKGCLDGWHRCYDGRPIDRNLLEFFTVDEPDRVRLPDCFGPYNVWDEGLFSYFFERKTDVRREASESLLDMYRAVYSLPNSARKASDLHPKKVSCDISVVDKPPAAAMTHADPLLETAVSDRPPYSGLGA